MEINFELIMVVKLVVFAFGAVIFYRKKQLNDTHQNLCCYYIR